MGDRFFYPLQIIIRQMLHFPGNCDHVRPFRTAPSGLLHHNRSFIQHIRRIILHNILRDLRNLIRVQGNRFHQPLSRYEFFFPDPALRYPLINCLRPYHVPPEKREK